MLKSHTEEQRGAEAARLLMEFRLGGGGGTAHLPSVASFKTYCATLERSDVCHLRLPRNTKEDKARKRLCLHF